jgi:hypothetical protein
MATPGVERCVLRAAVGDDNYAIVEQVASLLDSLTQRGVISAQGLGVLLSGLAAEIVAQKVIAEFGSGLSFGPVVIDTRTPEDPPT